MRDGDRDAAAVFVETYGELIRLRVRDKLSNSLRRVLDSEDVLSTVARRLDGLVLGGQIRATTQGELWSLVGAIMRNVVSENIRVSQRDRAVAAHAAESAPPESADANADDTDAMIERALEVVEDDTDRHILGLWLRDKPHVEIARSMGLRPSAVRMRWSRIKQALKSIRGRDNH